MEEHTPIGGEQASEEHPEGTAGAESGGEHQGAGAGSSGAAYKQPGAFDGVKAWASDVFGQASEVIVRPGEFFDNLPREGGLWRATVFAVVMGAVGGVIGFCLRVLPGFSSVFTTPFAAFTGTVVGAVIVHVLAMLAGGKGPLEASYRLAAYLMAFLPLVIAAGLLPYLNIAMAGYALYALILGAVSVHGLEERRAWSVFGAVGAAVLLLSLLGTFSGHGRSPSVLELQNLKDQQRRAAERLEKQIRQLKQRQAD